MTVKNKGLGFVLNLDLTLPWSVCRLHIVKSKSWLANVIFNPALSFNAEGALQGEVTLVGSIRCPFGNVPRLRLSRGESCRDERFVVFQGGLDQKLALNSDRGQGCLELQELGEADGNIGHFLWVILYEWRIEKEVNNK